MTRAANATADAFSEFDMREVTASDLDARLEGPGLVCLFLWGDDCFNCDIAKQQMRLHAHAVRALSLRWLHGNVYIDRPLGQRFALHGVPAFFFFRSGRKLGRITGWPGIDAFCAAVGRLQAQAA